MSVSYDGKKIVPAPFVEVQKEYIRTSDTHKIGSRFNLTLKGRLIYCNGSPNSDGDFWTASGNPDAAFQDDADGSPNFDGSEVGAEENRMASLIRKQEALRSLFSQDGKSFEVQPLNGDSPMKCNPKVLNITFSEGNWNQFVDYTITLQSEDLLGLPGEEDVTTNQDYFKDSEGNKLYLQDAQESWSLEFNDQPEDEDNVYTFRMTHNLSAVGIRHYLEAGTLHDEAYLQAKKWVTARLGIDNAFAHTTNLALPATYNPYNHTRVENTDELSGSYSVNETWLLSKTNVNETFTVSIRGSTDSSQSQVTIEGTIQGLDTRSTAFAITESKWTAALARFTSLTAGDPNHTIYTRANTLSGLTLNSTPISSTIGKNKHTGTITYSYEYDDRPTNCIEGAIFESFQITDQNYGDIFAIIPVIGRYAGPVLQDMGTRTELKRTLTVEVIMEPVSTCPTSAGNVSTLIAASPRAAVSVVTLSFYNHLRANFNQVFIESDQETWTPKNGRYNRTVTWVFQSCS